LSASSCLRFALFPIVSEALVALWQRVGIQE
jgi:hypothetical protein